MSTNHQRKSQIIYFGHGGGPLPLLQNPGHQKMLEFMKALPARLRRPDAILVISAHWEESAATLLGADNPPMLYDYYGFPDEAYDIVYPAPGNPPLAQRLAALLTKHNIPSRVDAGRGYDHGLFIPLKMMYPEADIPCMQLSLLRGLSPTAHLALGRALRELNDENILVIGSGFSFHNMRSFYWEGVGPEDPANDAFQDWLIQTCTVIDDQDAREERLAYWVQAPAARYCHPREEHLLPLHVCLAMAGDAAELVFDDQILGKRNVGFLWA